MNLARPIFICGDCKEILGSKSLEEDKCSFCQAELCPCICHIQNYKTCDACAVSHEGQ